MRLAPARKLPAIWLLRFAVSAVVLALIFAFVPVGDVVAEARKLPPALWLGGLALFLAGHFISSLKWRLLIGPGVSVGQAFRAHLAGLGANLALPGVAGGDVVRAAMVMGQARDRHALAVGSVADRLLDTLGLLLIALVGLFFAWEPRFGDSSTVRGLLIAGVAALLAGLALAVPLDHAIARMRLKGKVGALLTRIAEVAAEMVRRPGRLLVCLALSMAVQSVFVAINIAFADAAGLIVSNAAWFFAWSTAKIIAIAPISLGGLGVREASMAGLLKPFGADPAQVIAIGLIWQTVLYASGVIGLAVQALVRGPRPAVGAAMEQAR